MERILVREIEEKLSEVGREYTTSYTSKQIQSSINSKLSTTRYMLL